MITAIYNYSDVDISSTVLTVIDSVGLAQATTLNGYTSGEVTVNRVRDTYDNIKLIYNLNPAEVGADGVDLTAAIITVTDEINLVQAEDLNNFAFGIPSTRFMRCLHISEVAPSFFMWFSM